MKLTVNTQQWLRNENGEAVKTKLTDLKIDKTKERGQIRAINHNHVVKEVAEYEALPPPEPLRVTTRDASLNSHELAPIRIRTKFARICGPLRIRIRPVEFEFSPN